MTEFEISAAYTGEDHALREYDRYARAKYHLTLRWLQPLIRAGGLLYNIGVGGGYFNHLATRAGLRVVGCEPDPDAFLLAEASKPAQYCDLLPLGLDEFAKDREPADFAVMHDVLEHIDDHAGAAATLKSIVRPNGRIVLSVPALRALYGKHDEELGHFRRYSKISLRQVLEPHFKIHRLTYFGMASIPIVLYYSVLKRSSYPRSGAADNVLSKAYGAICDFESFISEPIGTSLIAELQPRT